MDRDVTLYQITNVMAERVFQKIDNFNKGRREDAGYYAISVSTLTDHIMHYGVYFRTIFIPLCLFNRWLSLLMMRQNVLFSICRTVTSC